MSKPKKGGKGQHAPAEVEMGQPAFAHIASVKMPTRTACTALHALCFCGRLSIYIIHNVPRRHIPQRHGLEGHLPTRHIPSRNGRGCGLEGQLPTQRHGLKGCRPRCVCGRGLEGCQHGLAGHLPTRHIPPRNGRGCGLEGQLPTRHIPPKWPQTHVAARIGVCTAKMPTHDDILSKFASALHH